MKLKNKNQSHIQLIFLRYLLRGPRTNNLEVSGISKNQDTFSSTGWANGVYEQIGFFNNQREFKHRISNFYIFYETVYDERTDETFRRWVVSSKPRTTANAEWFKISSLSYISSEIKLNDECSKTFQDEVVSVKYENIQNHEGVLKRLPDILPENIDEFMSTGTYQWYLFQAKDAKTYDDKNDASLVNSILEFLTRNDENSDFLLFLKLSRCAI